MEKKTERIMLIFTFLLAFVFRLIWTFKIPFFSSDAAYFNLRHSEHIVSNLVPIFYDPLSYGGNVIVDTHIFHYFLAIFDVFLPQAIVYKILPALLASSIVVIVYVLAKQITDNKYAAFFAALLTAFVPTFISTTINQISVLSVYIPTLLLLLSAVIAVKKYRAWFLLLAIVLILLDPLNLLMLFTLIIYTILLLSENVSLRRDEKEAVGFFIIAFLFTNLILFRTLLFEQGLRTVWQNLPLELYGSLFQNFDLFATITLIGVVPLIMGITGFILAKKKSKHLALLEAVLLATFTLLLLKLIPFEEGVLVLAIILCITSAITMKSFIEYIKITKIAKYTVHLASILFVISVASLLIPSIVIALDVINNGVTPGEVEALEWIEQETSENSVIIGNPNEGNMIIYLANRENVIDTHFFLAENRILDVETVYTTQSIVLAIQALDKFSVDYIYFSKKSKEFYGVEELVYTIDETCFEEVFTNEQATIYEVVC